MANMYIDQLYIDGFRTFDKLVIQCDKSANIIIGPNGVGKSTILKLLFLLTESSYNLAQEFQEEKYSFGIVFSSIKITKKIFDGLKIHNQSVKFNLTPGDDVITKIFDYFENPTPPQPQRIDLLYDDVKGKNVKIYLHETNIVNAVSRLYLRMFYQIDDILYGQTYIIGNNELFPILMEGGSLSFNYSDYVEKFRRVIEGSREFVAINDQLLKKSTVTFNKLSRSSGQSFELVGKPRLEIVVKNQDKKDINKLSSGQRQLENLRLFVKSVETINPSLVNLDEPEVHLNYGQQFYLLDFLSSLIQKGRQVFIATHSTFFIRSSDLKYIKYLKLNSAGFAEICEIPSGENRFLANYPELFYANNIILVEGLADKLFFERALNIVLKEKYSLDLSSLNTEIIAVLGKDKLNRLATVIKKNLKLNLLMIVDQDFALREASYRFLSDSNKMEIKKILGDIISPNLQSTSKMFKKMPQSLAEEFVNFLDSVFSSNEVTNQFRVRYQDYRQTFQVNKVLHIPGLKVRIKRIKDIFRTESVWLLEKGTIEEYVDERLINKRKLDIVALQDLFYPVNIQELKPFLKRGSLTNLYAISEHIKNNFSS